MHKNKDFGIISFHSSDFEVIHKNISYVRSQVLSVLQSLSQEGGLLLAAGGAVSLI